MSLTVSVAAQNFPDHTVKVIVPYVAGGGTDSVARAVSQGLQELWGQPVVVENKSGAGTSVGSEYAAKSAADGYTLLFSDSGALVINPHVYAKLRYDPIKDFEPVALAVRLAPVLAIANDMKAKWVGEPIAYAKHPAMTMRRAPPHASRWNISSTWRINMLRALQGSAP